MRFEDRIDLRKDELKITSARRAGSPGRDQIARLAVMPQDDVAKEIYGRVARCLDEYLVDVIVRHLHLSAEAAEPIAQAIIRLRTQRGEPRVRSAQSMAYIAFSSYCDPDLPIDGDGAAAALRAASYTVDRLPDKYRKFLQLPLDDHIEAVFGDPNLDNLADINAIVEDSAATAWSAVRSRRITSSSTFSPACQGSCPDQRST